jgi:PAS domain S-box-containing protein
METEHLFRVMADTAPVMIWLSGPDRLCTFFNKRWLDFTGRPMESELGDGWAQGVLPADLERCLQHYCESFDRREEFRIEYRLRRHDGEYRWLHDIGVPWFYEDGSFAGYIGSCFDITDSKRAAEALSNVHAHIIEAQEQERTRIARELHDEIGTELAILGVEMLRAGRAVSDSPEEKHPGVPELYGKLQDIATRVSRLAHILHAPALEYMGLAKAIEIESRQFSERYPIATTCSCSEVPIKLERVVALSFLRVVQEALHNAAKHSRAANVAVELVANASELTLSVSDDGVGFDLEQGRFAPGLGLISMRERMRLVGGDFEIRSKPGGGTRITCRAPLTRSQPS